VWHGGEVGVQGEMGTRGTAHGAPTLPRAARCMKLQKDDWGKVSLLTQTNKTVSFYFSGFFFSISGSLLC